MRVVRSLDGLFTAYNQCSVAPNGEYAIFKKCSDLLFYYEPEATEHNRELRLVIEDVLHRQDTIFDFAHLKDGRFVLLTQSPHENRVHLAQASINVEEAYVRVERYDKENIEIRTKGGQSKLIADECGPVLVTFPNNFAEDSPQSRTVQCFHVGEFFQQQTNVVKNVRIDRRIGANGRQLKELDYALIFFSQLVGHNQDQPSRKSPPTPPKAVWRLWLNSLVWEPIEVDHRLHWPVSKVSFRRADPQSSLAFLHGHCGRPECNDRHHFFQVDMFDEHQDKAEPSEDEAVETDKRKKQTLVRRFVKFASGRNQKPQLPYRNKKNSEAPIRTASYHSLIVASNRPPSATSSHTLQSTQTAPLASAGSCGSLLNWSRQMALQGGEVRLSEQLRCAKEMGFSDAEIWAALDVNNRNAHKPYEPFESISAMIDALSTVQKMGPTRGSTSSLASPSRFPSSSTLPAFQDERAKTLPSWTSSSVLSSLQPTLNTPPSANGGLSSANQGGAFGVNRSMSFNDSLALRRSFPSASTIGGMSGAYYLPQRTVKSSVQRLIDTFENENRRHFEEFQRINSELRRKLQNSINQEEHLQELLRLCQEKIRQQEILVKNQADSEKRLENANRRIQDLLKDVQLREADTIRQQGDLEALQRRHEAECRKAEEVKNTLNAEIGRLVRDNGRLEEFGRQNELLKRELEAKEEEIRRLSVPSDEVERLNAEMARLASEKRELEENQVQGLVCNREVIFMPCLHFTCCKRCADAMDHCSICRLRIMGKIEFFQ
ncbi:Viral A-type inclusion protein [Aphelenchoides fujianensis]|nr:Viral A-type inclusion protein [Aphelenchoides fujianensis]